MKLILIVSTPNIAVAWHPEKTQQKMFIARHEFKKSSGCKHKKLEFSIKKKEKGLINQVRTSNN